MRIFLTGGTGYIGSAVLEALLRAGHAVTAMVRDPEKAERLGNRGATPLLGELGLPKTYRAALADAEVVVHTAFEYSPRGVDKEREALELMIGTLRTGAISGPRALIYTSGVWVLGKTFLPADETTSLNPVPHVAWRPAHEQLVLDAQGDGLRTIVVRPGIVYGGGRGIVSEMLRDALNGLVRVVGPGRNHWPCIYDRDLADLYVRLVQAPDASGIYHANDEGDEKVNDIAEAMANHLAQRPDIRNMPIAEARKKLGPYADALALDQVVRSPRARALGWTPTLRSVSGNVARLFEEFRNSRS
ncbi:MAG: NAD-dependent epimerase/dehydratase family protein [Vicinamibacterales bacterium]